ncbi:hypothetical protein M885DRAFT_610059 [Pelagophyceae sp. CCMP2097]|nr:hypothetical protein M885DRAFT_610059 [Pelagophyceae sp. CCMP2097]
MLCQRRLARTHAGALRARAPAERLLHSGDWAALLGTVTTLNGRHRELGSGPRVAHGAALLASAVLPNIYSRLFADELPATTQLARALFSQARSGALLVSRDRAQPEASLDAPMTARLCLALLEGDRAFYSPGAGGQSSIDSFVANWQRTSGCGEHSVRASLDLARAAHHETVGRFLVSQGNETWVPPLGIGIWLARAWLDARDKGDLFEFANTVGNLKTAPQKGLVRKVGSPAAPPAGARGKRFWCGLAFDDRAHDALLHQCVGEAHSRQTTWSFEFAVAGAVRRRWLGLSARRHDGRPAALPAPDSYRPTTSAALEARPDCVERALREVVAALCWDASKATFDVDAPAMAHARGDVRQWFHEYNDDLAAEPRGAATTAATADKAAGRGAGQDLAGAAWFDVCSRLTAAAHCRHHRDGAYELKASRANFVAALCELLGAADVSDLERPAAACAPRVELESLNASKTRLRVVGDSGVILAQILLRPGLVAVERSICRLDDDQAEASAFPPWARALELLDADSLGDAWLRQPRCGASPWLLAALTPPAAVENLAARGHFDAVHKLLVVLPPGAAGSLARARLAEVALRTHPAADGAVVLVRRLAALEACRGAHAFPGAGVSAALAAWRARVAEACFSSKAVSRHATAALHTLLVDELGFLDEAAAVHVAARYDAVDWLALLRDHGRDLDAPDAKGSRPLAAAASHGALESMLFLFRGGARPDAAVKPDDGARAPPRPPPEARPDRRRAAAEVRSPLAWASKSGQGSAVALLLSRGADPNRCDQDAVGLAPLHLAKNVDVANRLLEAGADVRLRSGSGHTPLDVLPAHITRHLRGAPSAAAAHTAAAASQRPQPRRHL